MATTAKKKRRTAPKKPPVKSKQAAPEISKAPEITTKTIRGVSILDKEKFQDLASEAGKTEGEFFSHLVNSSNADDSDLLNQIGELKQQLENKNTTDEIISKNLDSLIDATGAKNFDEALALINNMDANANADEKVTLLQQQVKDLQELNNEYAEKIGGMVNGAAEGAAEIIKPLTEKIQELETKLQAHDSIDIEKLAEMQQVIMTEFGFQSFEAAIEGFRDLSKQKKDLEDELELEKSSEYKLEGNQFVGDINEKNFALALKYRPTLFRNKLIEGSDEDYPNELINWAIPTALRHTFAKLPEV